MQHLCPQLMAEGMICPDPAAGLTDTPAAGSVASAQPSVMSSSLSCREPWPRACRLQRLSPSLIGQLCFKAPSLPFPGFDPRSLPWCISWCQPLSQPLLPGSSNCACCSGESVEPREWTPGGCWSCCSLLAGLRTLHPWLWSTARGAR